MAYKVGVFDSGVGGITVLKELQNRFPWIDYVYLGDTAHVPYGPKSPHQIRVLSIAGAEILKEKKVDQLIVACNTASSWALTEISQVMAGVPVIGVVDPGVESVIEALQAEQELKNPKNPRGPVVILATRATVQSHAYRRALEVPLKTFRFPVEVIEQACPLLVPMIEEGWIDHPILDQTIAEYTHAYRVQYPSGVALLGCTHYPWIEAAFQRALPGWKIVDSARAVALAFEKNGLEKPKDGKRNGHVEWIFTDPEAVPSFARQLLGESGIP